MTAVTIRGVSRAYTGEPLAITRHDLAGDDWSISGSGQQIARIAVDAHDLGGEVYHHPDDLPYMRDLIRRARRNLLGASVTVCLADGSTLEYVS